MALALIVLALGSAVAGYIGTPESLGGHNALGDWLAPSFAARSVTTLSNEQVAEAGEPGRVGEAGGDVEGGLELSLMVVSSIVAIVGIGLAAFIWLKRREIADAIAARFPGMYRLLLNKYYVDEIYDAVIVQPIKRFSTTALWRGVDVGLIDGAVNGVGTAVRQMGDVLRRLQTGSVRSYAVSFVVGVIVVLGYYLLL